MEKTSESKGDSVAGGASMTDDDDLSAGDVVVEEAPSTASFDELRKTRDPELRSRLVCEHLYLVSPIVRKFREAGELAEDLVQVGYIGLIKAVDSFNSSYHVKFSTYATHFISGEIRHYLRDKVDVIKRPRWLSALSRKTAGFLENFLQTERRLPTIAEIAHGINVSEEGVVEILKSRATISLTPVEDAAADQVAVGKIKSLRYETLKLPVEDHIALMEALETLKSIEQAVVYMFFYKDLTQTEIARSMGLSQKKVSRLLHKALGRMRDILNRELW